jgi:hypothetical protein
MSNEKKTTGTEAAGKKPLSDKALAELEKLDPNLAALKDASEFATFAKRELAEFEKLQTFEMTGIATDKNGEETKVLMINTDADSVIEMFMIEGNPFEAGEGVLNQDKPLLAEYVRAMSNIDLTDAENLKLAGMNAISQARGMVAGFFMLSMIASLDLPTIPEQPK